MLASSHIAPAKPGTGWKTLLKILISVLCLTYIGFKVNYRQLAGIMITLNPFWMMLAVFSFMFSKLLSSFRLNIYFRNIDIFLPEAINLKLYWLGMLYNLFLPGSVSGDGYKVVRLARLFDIPMRKTAAAVLLDRISGLIALVLLLSFCWLAAFGVQRNSLMVVAGAIAFIAGFYFVVRWLFASFLPGYWSTFLYGIAVQAFQVASMFCLLRSLNIHDNELQYLLIFLVSSVVAVLPLTIGGLGAREMVFMWGAQLFLLNNTVSVSASALFYCTTVISSLPGLYFVFNDPLSRLQHAPAAADFEA